MIHQKLYHIVANVTLVLSDYQGNFNKKRTLCSTPK
jgi:hypothetical protein